MLSSRQIREDFLRFFEELNHQVVPSSPVVPREDPTLLFANAGMNQFKDVFLGQGERNYSRAASTQKCLRVSGKHNDLDEVGRDTYHHTLFEMLGNWSFGDYYKRDAIRWAWKLLTEVWKLPKDKLYATVFEGNEDVPFDQEAWDIWMEETDIPRDHVLKFGAKDNFWEMGETGPCGPCTEIHIDRGERFGKLDPKTCFVNTDADRFIELWNLVFIQYNRDASGKLSELPAKHVDTGAGFERLCAVLQNKDSNYDTDVFQPLIQKVAELSGVAYSEITGTPHRVIADHVRALAFAIADGAIPGNEGRGYVLRRILRRASRFGRELGMEKPFLGEVAATLADHMGEAFPELPAKLKHVQHVLGAEEESFGRTLGRGLDLFANLKDELDKTGSKVVPGEEAFRLYDTFGFPLDLTQQMASEHGLSVDEAGFAEAMERQRSQSRDSRKQSGHGEKAAWNVLSRDTNRFMGYDVLETMTRVLRWREGQETGSLELVLEQTPFYAESGGQIGDRGVIEGEGWKLLIGDTRKEEDLIVHVGELKGTFNPEDMVSARVEQDLRRSTMRNHSATHLLQSALRHVLGDHVQQEGSLVEPGRLRFDFSHPGKPDSTELDRVERLVYEQILADSPVQCGEMGYQQAIDSGVTALFGEKYGDTVRVIRMGEFSAELCGGTHVERTGQIGAFTIVAESSIASGIRRIEAVTGHQAQQLIQQQRRQLHALRDLLGSHGEDDQEALARVLDDRKQLQKELRSLKARSAGAEIEQAFQQAEKIGDTRCFALRIEGAEMNELKGLCDRFRTMDEPVAALVCSLLDEGKVVLAVSLSEGLRKATQLKAGDLVRQLAPLVGGGGGGRPDMATAGGKDASGLDELEAAFRSAIQAGSGT